MLFRSYSYGFTLVELMITIAILGLLSSIAIPYYSDIARKTYEARTKANLGTIRSALSIYFGDTEGMTPLDDLTSLKSKYLTDIPVKYTPPFHPEGNDVSAGDDTAMATAKGDWFYFNVPASANFGKVVVNCVHTDLREAVWSSY